MRFAPAGLQLAVLTKAQIVPALAEFVVQKWRAAGHTVTIMSPDCCNSGSRVICHAKLSAAPPPERRRGMAARLHSSCVNRC